MECAVIVHVIFGCDCFPSFVIDIEPLHPEMLTKVVESPNIEHKPTKTKPLFQFPTSTFLNQS